MPANEYVCDHCGLDPIVGFRYRCKECDVSNQEGYDLCIACYQQRDEVHDKGHHFVAFSIGKKRKPMTQRVLELEEKVRVLEEMILKGHPTTQPKTPSPKTNTKTPTSGKVVVSSKKKMKHNDGDSSSSTSTGGLSSKKRPSSEVISKVSSKKKK